MTPTRGRARIGMLVPFTNANLEPDFAMMCPAGVSIHTARMGGYDEQQVPDEAQMQGLGAADLDEPLHLLSGIKPDVVVYGCTSATLTHGVAFDRALANRITADSGARTVTAAGALVHALAALGVTRIGFASPYVPAINDMAVAFLADAGIETVARAEVEGTLGNHEQGGLTPQDVIALGLRADHAHADAIVLSCTEMRSVETLDQLETALGKPVVSSNQAMMFEVLGALGIKDARPGFGRILESVRHELSLLHVRLGRYPMTPDPLRILLHNADTTAIAAQARAAHPHAIVEECQTYADMPTRLASFSRMMSIPCALTEP